MSHENKTRALYNTPEWENRFEKKLQHQLRPICTNPEENLETILNEFRQRKKGKVRKAGTHLRHLYPVLPAKEQCAVGLALLQNTKRDAEYVCKKLINKHNPLEPEPWNNIQWFPEYAKVVVSNWERYPTPLFAHIVLKYLDSQYIRSNFDTLLQQVPYFHLCNRLIAESWFQEQIDLALLKSQTDITSYLYIYSRTPHPISDAEARELLYQWVAYTAWVAILVPECSNSAPIGFNPLYLSGIDNAIHYLYSMNKDNVVEAFAEWSKAVATQVQPEADKIDREHIQSWIAVNNLFYKTALRKIPEDLDYLKHLDILRNEYQINPALPFAQPHPNSHSWLYDESVEATQWQLEMDIQGIQTIPEESETSNIDFFRQTEAYPQMAAENPVLKTLGNLFDNDEHH